MLLSSHYLNKNAIKLNNEFNNNRTNVDFLNNMIQLNNTTEAVNNSLNNNNNNNNSNVTNQKEMENDMNMNFKANEHNCQINTDHSQVRFCKPAPFHSKNGETKFYVMEAYGMPIFEGDGESCNTCQS